jgi:polyphosphate kinase
MSAETKNNSSAPAVSRFLNRELSSLAFQRRVLEEAQNPAQFLLERIKFLSILGSNLDEFTNVRVASLRDVLAAGHDTAGDDGLLVSEQLAKINERIYTLGLAAQQTWLGLRQELQRRRIQILPLAQLSGQHHAWLDQYFMQHIFPILTPLAIDPAHPFPFLINKSKAILLHLREKQTQKTMRAIIPLPRQVNRFIKLTGKGHRFALLEDVVALFFDRLFPGFEVIGYGIFRILRDLETELEEQAEDLVSIFEDFLKKRSRGQVIRLLYSRGMPQDLREFLWRELSVTAADAMEIDGLIGLSDLAELYKIDAPDLKFPVFTPRYPPRVVNFNGDYFAAIRHKDFIVHHPYESFDTVVHFLQQAAGDPDVISIRQTLYRTSQDSPVMRALIEAAEAGKSVTVMVELKARFDEEANIRWAKNLERAGAQVVFGFLDLKTHAKISLVVRKEGEALRSYAHFGTGNYNPITSRFYSDLSLFTADAALCQDAARLFNFMTGYAKPEKMAKLVIAPLQLRKKLLALFDAEIQNAKAGRPAAIWAKMNSLVDPEIIDRLYAASQAGVKIELIVRGICCLRPGVPGLSDNIKVRSIVGRFLEHARLLCVANGSPMPSADTRVYLSSADWMQRNLNGRVEVLVPIENPTVHAQVLNQVMWANLEDNSQAWELGADGQYRRVQPGNKKFSAHEYFLTHPSLSGVGGSMKRADKKVLKLRHKNPAG